MDGSKHYEGNAFDFRTWTTDTSGVQMPMKDKIKLGKGIQKALGSHYQVVVEVDHIHIEYDRK